MSELQDLTRRFEEERQVREHAESLLEKKNLELQHVTRVLNTHSIALEEANRELKRQKQEFEIAQSAAIAAANAKSEFLANMSHEIRTPLNAILGFTDLLRRGVDEGNEKERQDWLATIHTSARHLLEVIDDILDLSKIEAGRVVMERIPCAPSEVIGDVVSMLRPRAREKNLYLEVEYSGKIPRTICTDPTRLRQLLMNLLGNAIKFTEMGGVRVVTGLGWTEGTARLRMEVIDTGIGISPEKLQTIFDPFVQADSSTTRKFGGTGLGLAICKRFASALGGSLTVASQLGEGSVFTCEIDAGPMDGVEFLSDPVTEVLVERRRGEPGNIAPMLRHRILVVDDGGTNRKLISLILRRAGAEVTTANDGQAAVEHASRGRFDLILMDMQMPVMDGYVASRTLRQLGFTCPIIALTAHAMQGDEDKSLAAGCSGYLAKPVDAELLLQTVAAALGVSGASPGTCPAALRSTGERDPLRSTLPADDVEFQEVVEEFVTRLGVKLEEMRGACAARDLENLAQLAHWLKGAGGTAGFAAFTEPAGRLEQLARRQKVDSLEEALAELVQLTDRIETEGTKVHGQAGRANPLAGPGHEGTEGMRMGYEGP